MSDWIQIAREIVTIIALGSMFGVGLFLFLLGTWGIFEERKG